MLVLLRLISQPWVMTQGWREFEGRYHDPGLKEKFGIGHHAYGEILLFVGFVSMNGHQDDYLNMTM